MTISLAFAVEHNSLMDFESVSKKKSQHLLIKLCNTHSKCYKYVNT